MLREKLRIKLAELEISQRELARRAGVHHELVGMIARGRTTNPRVQSLIKIATVLDMRMDELIEEEIDKEREKQRRGDNG